MHPAYRLSAENAMSTATAKAAQPDIDRIAYRIFFKSIRSLWSNWFTTKLRVGITEERCKNLGTYILKSF